MGKNTTSKKVSRSSVSTKVPDFTEGMNHMQLFHHLIAAGPTMHGTPGKNSKKSH